MKEFIGTICIIAMVLITVGLFLFCIYGIAYAFVRDIARKEIKRAKEGKGQP